MARLSLSKLRKNVKERQPSGQYEAVWSPMGNLEVGETATIRFLPYEDELSGGFWTAQKMIKLEFVDPDSQKPFKYYLPSLETYVSAADQKCPVANLTRGLFQEAKSLKDEGSSKEAEMIEKVALNHWFNYAYYMQGFILNTSNSESVDPNEIRPIKLPKTVYTNIHTSVVDETAGFDQLPTGEFDMSDIKALMDGNVPDGYDEDTFMSLFLGRNYIVRKTTKGEYNNYETSSWEMKETALTDEQVTSLHENGLLDMTTYLPPRPSDEQYEILTEMAQVSIDHALGRSEGLWNPEWEEFGINKPQSAKSNVGKSESSNSLKDRIRNKVETETVETKVKSRGAKKVVVEDTAEDDEAPDVNSKVAAMRARIKAKKAKASA